MKKWLKKLLRKALQEEIDQLNEHVKKAKVQLRRARRKYYAIRGYRVSGFCVCWNKNDEKGYTIKKVL